MDKQKINLIANQIVTFVEGYADMGWDDQCQFTGMQLLSFVNEIEGNLMLSHYYCDNCQKIMPATFRGANHIDVSGEFIGGDIVCNECAWIIATGYMPRRITCL